MMTLMCSGQVGSLDEEERPTACVGICYYNKLMALEAKEDLANHNMVYKTDDVSQNKSIFTRYNVSAIVSVQRQRGAL